MMNGMRLNQLQGLRVAIQSSMELCDRARGHGPRQDEKGTILMAPWIVIGKMHKKWHDSAIRIGSYRSGSYRNAVITAL